MTSQPDWKLIAQLGDVNYADYGGYFVYEDRTRVYPAEAEYLEVIEGRKPQWEIYRFILEPCTYQGGVLSDNPFHPHLAAWFAQPEEKENATGRLSDLSRFVGVSTEELIEQFCSEDPVQRAQAYRIVGEYHGWENLDSYSLTISTRREVLNRYERAVRQL